LQLEFFWIVDAPSQNVFHFRMNKATMCLLLGCVLCGCSPQESSQTTNPAAPPSPPVATDLASQLIGKWTNSDVTMRIYGQNQIYMQETKGGMAAGTYLATPTNNNKLALAVTWNPHLEKAFTVSFPAKDELLIETEGDYTQLLHSAP
jgi:hypothetical protein